MPGPDIHLRGFKALGILKAKDAEGDYVLL